MSDLSNMIVAWDRQWLWERCLKSSALLHCHGLLSDAECDRVRHRLEKALARQGLTLIRAETTAVLPRSGPQ